MRREVARPRPSDNAVVDDLAEIFFSHDPIRLRQFGVPPNEYLTEAESMLSRLEQARSADEVQTILYDVLVQKFGVELAGQAAWYDDLARAIWEYWQSRGATR